MQKAGAHVERALAFVAAFVGFAEGKQDEASACFADDLLQEVLGCASVLDKTLRTRACQMLALMLNQLPDLDDGLLASLQHTLLARLRDKLPAVRRLAAVAVARLADPGEVRWKNLACGSTASVQCEPGSDTPQ